MIKGKRVKFVMTAEIALSRVAGRQVCSKHMEKKTLTWIEGSKSVPLRGEVTGVAVDRRFLSSPRQRWKEEVQDKLSGNQQCQTTKVWVW